MDSIKTVFITSSTISRFNWMPLKIFNTHSFDGYVTGSNENSHIVFEMIFLLQTESSALFNYHKRRYTAQKKIEIYCCVHRSQLKQQKHFTEISWTYLYPIQSAQPINSPVTPELKNTGRRIPIKRSSGRFTNSTSRTRFCRHFGSSNFCQGRERVEGGKSINSEFRFSNRTEIFQNVPD